jgi:hypothetical protein
METFPMTKQYVVLALALALCVGASSCAKSQSGPKGRDGAQPVARQPAPGDGGGAKPQAAVSAPAIPAGAEWTIYCTTIPGLGHIQQSTNLRDQLVKSTGMRDWYVVHGENDSTLYYGFYKSLDKSIKSAREKIDAMTDATGGRPFRNALIVELTTPDPEAPAQWDLANAPAGMVWSVQIAAYEGSPQRKKFAVDAVREARGQGVPAYYFHGPSISSVCVGAWPKEAVRGEMEPSFNDPNEKRSLDQIMQQQPGDVIVLPPGMPAMNKQIQTRRGTVRTISSQLEVVDPTMLATIKSYPYHYRNGEAEGVKSAEGLQPKPSFLVKIPRRAGSLLGGDATLAGSGPLRPNPQAPSEPRRPAPSQPGYGTLRSLGGN